MIAEKASHAARSSTAGERRARPGASRLAAIGLCVAAVFFAASALAESIRVSASSDPKLSPTQARQQALDRALPEAVYQGALRMLPAPPAEARAQALRGFLAPHAIDYVQSYQEVAPASPDAKAGEAGAQDNATSAGGASAPAAAAKTPADEAKAPAKSAPTSVSKFIDAVGAASAKPAEAPAVPAAQAAPAATGQHNYATLELDVTIQRTYLRNTLTELGFLAGSKHPGAYVLRLGPGVKEKDTAALPPLDVLLGLTRVKAAPQQAQGQPGPVEVSLERLPQGYYKAVLRHQGLALAADAPDIPTLWQRIWGRYFTDARLQPGVGKQVLAIGGFSGVDAVQDFVKLMAGWENAVLQPSIGGLDIAVDGVSARFTCRVVNQDALDAHLRETLPALKLTLIGQTPDGPPPVGQVPDAQGVSPKQGASRQGDAPR